MATSFGEVRTVSSRAYDEADDDEDSPSITYDVRVELGKGGKNFSNAETLLISYGTLATEFCERLVVGDRQEVAGHVYVKAVSLTECDDTGDFHARPPVPSRLMVTAGSLAVCCVSQDVVPPVALQFVRKVLGLVSTTCPVVVLSSHHYGQLRGNYSPSSQDNCVVHSLCSPTFTYTPVYPQLPQPAILDSVPAAVLTESMVSGRPCVLYPAYTETYSTGELDLVADALLRILQVNPLLKYLPRLPPSNTHQHRTKPREDFDRYT